MKKIQILSILLVFILSLITPSISQAQTKFSDVPNDFWAYKEIQFLTDSKIINGYQNGNYGPNDEVKRVQAAVMISRALKLDLNNRPNPGFKDIPTNYYAYKEIAAVVDEGFFLKGENFNPQEPLKRSDMSIALVKAFDLTGKYYGPITDVVDNTYIPYVNTLAANKITNIYADGTFKPNNTVKRAHFAVFFARVLDSKFIDDTNDLKVSFIDVGQGSSTLLLTPNGKTILVDGGAKSAGEKVVSYLKQAGVSTIDLVVASHPDADHIGGLIAVLETFKVNKVLDSGKVHTSQTYLDYLDIIDKKNIPLEIAKEGSDIAIDSALKIKVLNSSSDNKDNNQSSVVLKVSYGTVDFLLTGDAEAEQESEMVQKYDVSAEVLLAGHHGSSSSTSQVFLNEVQPKVSILSYGANNSYGHPTSEVVTRLVNAKSDIYGTATSGDIVVSTDGKVYSVVATPFEVKESPNASTSTIDLVSVDLDAEIVTIKNTGTTDQDMTGWKIVSVEGNQTYDFPSGYILKAGATVYVTSGRNAKDEPPTYLKWTGSYIWNNDGDSAELYNAKGEKVDEIR